MKSHVWRPLYVVIVFVAALLLFRFFYVPSDFGSGKRGFMYSYHRKSNVTEWKNMPAKYGTSGREGMHEYCITCHGTVVKVRKEKLHGIIPCEDCHGPAMNHPEKPEKLNIDRSRDLCLRCHANLPYITSERKRIPGVNPKTHNTGAECVKCHNPHNPSLEGMK